MSDPFGMIDPELLVATCDETGAIRSRNGSWIRLLGDGETLWERLVDGDRETADHNLAEAASGTLITHALFMVRRMERDEPVPLLLHFIPVATATGCAVSMTGEILSEPTTWTESHTERHRMETLGRMTLGMAHDFNNLLSGILGHLELWTAEDPESAARAENHIRTMQRAATDGAELIHKVQRYIRQESRSGFAPVHVPALLLDCVAFTRPYWFNEPRRQGIEIVFDHTLDDVPSINGSSSELRDVFVNLILNAVHALPDGGRLHMTCSCQDDMVRMELSDTGHGMTPEVLSHIFEPLFSTKGERGTGMGLAVAAGIIREHDGTIQARSEVGKGTTFTVELPLPTRSDDLDALPAEGVEADTRPSPPRSMATDGNIRAARAVLVVDDEAMVRNVVSKLLSLHGHRVHLASSGQEGLDVLAQESIDIVFTDQGMPRMSGREFAHQTHRLYPELPVVLLTGDTDLIVDQQEILRVLTKPFRLDDLLDAIHALTESAPK